MKRKQRKQKALTINYMSVMDLESWLRVRYPKILKRYEEEKEEFYIYE